MQFSKIFMAVALASIASATPLEKKNGGGGGGSSGGSGGSATCSSIALCQTGGKTECKPPADCTASSGSPYCCTSIGLVNVLNCVNLLNGNSVNISLLDGLTLPISL